MKYVDFIGQSIILIVALALAIAIGGTGLLLSALALGAWQMVSSIISFASHTALRKYKAFHLILAILYLALFFLFQKNIFAYDNAVALPLVMTIAWALGIYYYIVTYCWAFSDTKRSKFLPNISF
jgi:hypothetical protein